MSLRSCYLFVRRVYFILYSFFTESGQMLIEKLTLIVVLYSNFSETNFQYHFKILSDVCSITCFIAKSGQRYIVKWQMNKFCAMKIIRGHENKKKIIIIIM